MTIKESFDWIDSPSTWGNPVFKDNYPQADGVAVRRLQSAGAIIFGKTNVGPNVSLGERGKHSKQIPRPVADDLTRPGQ